MNGIELQTLKKYLCWFCAAVTAVGLPLSLKHGMTPIYGGFSISPRQVYRLEYYRASPLQRLWYYNMNMPTFVRLYRIDPETLMGESNMADVYLNGELYWYLYDPTNAIQIGRDIVFENVPSECADCPPLTRKQVVCGADPICLIIHSDPLEPQENPSDG